MEGSFIAQNIEDLLLEIEKNRIKQNMTIRKMCLRAGLDPAAWARIRKKKECTLNLAMRLMNVLSLEMRIFPSGALDDKAIKAIENKRLIELLKEAKVQKPFRNKKKAIAIAMATAEKQRESFLNDE